MLSVSVENGRVVARRTGFGDWQDAFEAFERIALALHEGEGEELLIDLSAARSHLRPAETTELAAFFRESIPEHVRVAIIPPQDSPIGSGHYRFVGDVRERGYRLKICFSQAQADAFFQKHAGRRRPKPAAKPRRAPSPLSRLAERLGSLFTAARRNPVSSQAPERARETSRAHR